MVNEVIEANLDYKLKNIPKEEQLKHLLRLKLVSKYPGIDYRIGLLYEQGIVKSNDLYNHIIWYQKAAEANYEPAIERLNQLNIEY